MAGQQVALISDIHGNLVALETVLDDIARQHADEVICLGDIAADGPQPGEVVARMRTLGFPVVMGNADAELVEFPEAPDSAGAAPQSDCRFLLARWTRTRLSTGDLMFLRSFQFTFERKLGGEMTLLCCHGSPHSRAGGLPRV